MSGAPRQAARANGRRAGGPRSASGKARSSQNALRHGLSLPLLVDPAASAEVVALARAIAAQMGAGEPNEGPPELTELTRRVAEAQLDIVRVRRARHDLIAAALADPDYVSPHSKGERAQLLERATNLARSGRLPPFLDPIITALRRTPNGPDKFALILADLSPRLSAMDRYERRACSRRKFAMRAFDEERLRFAFLQL